MTNEKLIVKIKTEIERLKNKLIRGACATQIEMRTMYKEEAYDEILSFLSTIEKSEPEEKMLGGVYSSYDIAKAFVEGQYSILKNLNKYCPSWKPSEHQMTILKAIKAYYVGRGSRCWGEEIGSIIEDLEKLM